MKIQCAYDAIVDPQTLKPHPLNPNEHNAQQLDLFAEILKYQGWRRPITVSKFSGYITKGHGAVAAALLAGFTQVPVDYQDYDGEAQELADIVADNQLARMSQMNNVKLQDLIVKLDGDSLNLELTGFKMDRIEMIMNTVPGFGSRENSDDFSLRPDHDHHVDNWQTDIERSRKEVDAIEPNTDGIVATIKILCPQPMAGALKEQLKKFLEMVKDDFEGVALA